MTSRNVIHYAPREVFAIVSFFCRKNTTYIASSLFRSRIGEMRVSEDDAAYFQRCSGTQFWADNDRVETLISLYSRSFELHRRRVSSDVVFANIYSGILRVTRTGRIYGPYIRVNFLTPVHTGRKYGCQKCTRTYGPYVRVVRIGLKTQCSKTFKIMGLIAIPLKSLQNTDLIQVSSILGIGTI